MCKVVMLVMEIIHLGIEVLGRFSSTEDCGMVSKTIHCAAEAIATYSSTDPNVLCVIIAHYAMILMLHERQDRVGDPLSGEVMTMAFMVLFRQGAILSMLGAAGCSTSQQCIASLQLVLQQRAAMRWGAGARRWRCWWTHGWQCALLGHVAGVTVLQQVVVVWRRERWVDLA